MTDDEQQLIKIGAAALLQPYTDLVKQLFGTAIDEMGRIFGEEVRLRCDLRRAKVLGKLRAAIEEAQFEPQKIPDYVWIPAFTAASFEDDETIQDIWANMMANAADPRQQNPIHPSFLDMVKGLSAREVRFLSALYAIVLENMRTPYRASEFNDYDLKAAYAGAGLSRQPKLGGLAQGDFDEHGDDHHADLKDFAMSLKLILRLGILTEEVTPEPIDLSDITAQIQRKTLRSKLELDTKTKYTFTELGRQFMNVCQKPPKAS